jgi:hypothetical protein
VNYVENRPGRPLYLNLSESGFFGLFFSDSVIKIILKETNVYTKYQIQQPPLSLYLTRQWVPTTIAEIHVYIGINLYFGLYSLIVRDDY